VEVAAQPCFFAPNRDTGVVLFVANHFLMLFHHCFSSVHPTRHTTWCAAAQQTILQQSKNYKVFVSLMPFCASAVILGTTKSTPKEKELVQHNATKLQVECWRGHFLQQQEHKLTAEDKGRMKSDVLCCEQKKHE
jgi:hypothetical protein